MERRTAISGLMPARPLRMPDSVLRLTPSDRAASVTVKFRGSRHSILSTSPGCGGLCIFIFTSVVVLVVDAIHVLAGTRERDAPVAAHLDGPRVQTAEDPVAMNRSSPFVRNPVIATPISVTYVVTGWIWLIVPSPQADPSG